MKTSLVLLMLAWILGVASLAFYEHATGYAVKNPVTTDPTERVEVELGSLVDCCHFYVDGKAKVCSVLPNQDCTHCLAICGKG
jgi:hypothetical protein